MLFLAQHDKAHFWNLNILAVCKMVLNYFNFCLCINPTTFGILYVSCCSLERKFEKNVEKGNQYSQFSHCSVKKGDSFGAFRYDKRYDKSEQSY